MKFAITFAAAALLASTSDAFSTPKVTPVAVGNAVVNNNNADSSMSQYDAALKAAFEQASAAAVPSPVVQQQELAAVPSPVVQQQELAQEIVAPVSANTEATIDANAALLEHVQQQEQAIDQYETALNAALESSKAEDTAVAPTTIVFGEEAAVAPEAAPAQQQPDWDNVSQAISSKIEIAESKKGGPLDAASKGEIVGTVLAGSAVLGTAAINSPLLMGAALGYAGTHVFGGERGEALAKSSKDALRDAVIFTQAQLEHEQGDISKASARIVEHLQKEGKSKAKEFQQAAQIQGHQVSREISKAPAHMVEEGKKIVQSEDFQQMPNRTFKAVKDFWGSDEVKRARESVVTSIKDGLESEELQAVKNRATRSLKDI